MEWFEWAMGLTMDSWRILDVVKTMSFLPPIFLGMVSLYSLYHIYKNGDDWGMVNMTLF